MKYKIMNPTEKFSYRLFLEKIFLSEGIDNVSIKEILKKDNKIICITSIGVSIWELYNKNLLFDSFYNKNTIEYEEIIKEVEYENG